MIWRLAGVAGTLVVTAIALATPTLLTSAPAGASDTTAVLVPSNNATVSGTQVVLDASAPGATSVQFEGVLNGDFFIANAVPTIYGWIGKWNTVSWDNGDYPVVSVASFPDGTTVTSAPITLDVENPPPTVAVATPSNGATVSGVVGIDAVPSADTTSIDVYVTPASSSDLVPVSDLDTPTPTLFGWVTTWDTRDTANGTYYLFVEVDDRITREVGSQIVTVTVDNPNSNPPRILVPSNNATVSGTQVVLDTTNPTTRFLLWQQPAFSPPFIATATPTMYGNVAVWNSTTVPNGTYTLYGTTPPKQIPPDWTAGITVTVDNPPPMVTLTSPQTNAIVVGSVPFTATTSPSGVSEVDFSVQGPNDVRGTVIDADTTPTNNTWTTEFDSTGVPNGTYTLSATASYLNRANTTSSITVTVAN